MQGRGSDGPSTGDGRNGAPRPAEFDAYAAGYDAGMDNPIKRLLGLSATQYVDVKARWLLGDLARFPLPVSGRAPRLLDFGCGAGTLLKVLESRGWGGSLAGCDVSRAMLEQAARPPSTRADLRVMEGKDAPFEPGAFDVVVASAVLHHVPPPDRGHVYSELLRVLGPSGRIYVFEHNPRNPVTRLVVSRTPIDRNAILLRREEVERGLRQAGGQILRSAYLMFGPPRLDLSLLEAWLGSLPIGAQHVVVAAGRVDSTAGGG